MTNVNTASLLEMAPSHASDLADWLDGLPEAEFKRVWTVAIVSCVAEDDDQSIRTLAILLGRVRARVNGQMVAFDGRRHDPVEIGRLGGLKGGPARAAKMTAKQRSEACRKAAKARWAKNAGRPVEL